MKAIVLPLFIGLWFISWAGIAQNTYSITKKLNIQAIPALSKVPYVMDIFEDHYGLIWIGTQRGLYKFDGYELKHYAFDPTKLNKLAGNWITKVTEDDKGYLWISVFGIGLQRLDPLTDTFLLFKPDPKKVNSLADSQIKNISFHSPFLWIDTILGPCCLNVNTFTFSRFAIRESNDLKKKILTKLNTGNDLLFKNTIIEIDNKLLFHNNLQKLSWLYPNSNEIPPVTLTKSQKQKIVNDKEFDNSFRLRNGDIWLVGDKIAKIGSNENGIESYELSINNRKIDLKHPNATIRVRDDGRVNIGQAVIVDYQRSKAIPKKYEYPFLKLFDEAIDFNLRYTQEYLDKKGNYWIALFDRPQSAITIYKIYTSEKRLEKIIEINNNRCVLMGIAQENNNIWIANWCTLEKYNIITKKYTIFKHTGDSTGICSGGLRCIYIDKSGDLWVGTHGGLSRRPKGKNYFVNYLSNMGNTNYLSYNSIACINEQSNGQLLIGTMGGGLNIFDKKNNQFKWITKKEGLAGNDITNIQVDNDGSVWMSNGIGLSCWDPITNKVQNFNSSDGVFNYLSENTSTKFSDGSLFFGGDGGFNIIHPKKIKADNIPTPIFITDIKLFNQSVLTEGKRFYF